MVYYLFKAYVISNENLLVIILFKRIVLQKNNSTKTTANGQNNANQSGAQRVFQPQQIG